MRAYNILAVEMSAHNTGLISEYLNGAGFELNYCDSATKVPEFADSKQVDLVILELGSTKPTNWAAYQKIRQVSHGAPILLLSNESDPISGLPEDQLLFVDFLVKPFCADELIARMRALMRRYNMMHELSTPSAPKGEMSFDNIVIDISRHKVETRDGIIALTAREFDLLVFLASAPGRVFRRERLLDAVWGSDHRGSVHTVNTQVNRLRLKIEADPAKPEYVKTVWGVGYKFNGQIRVQ